MNPLFRNDWECPECGQSNVGGDDECQAQSQSLGEGCCGLRPFSRMALDEEIEGCYAPEDEQVLVLERAYRGLTLLEESEFVRRSPVFAFLLFQFEYVLRQAKTIADFQGMLYMMTNRIPDSAPFVFEEMEKAYSKLSEVLSRNCVEEAEASGMDESGVHFNKVWFTYVYQMFEELTRNGPESAE